MTTAPSESPDKFCSDSGHGRLRQVAASFSADVHRYLNKSPENRAAGVTLKSTLGALLTTQLMCMFLYRLSHFLRVNGFRRLAVALSRLNYFVHKVNITPESCIGAGCFIPHPVGVTFHGTAGEGLTLYSMAVCCLEPVAMEGPAHTAPVLGDRVIVGGRAVVLGPVRVGSDTKVFAVRVTSDIPGGALAVCNRSRQRIRVRGAGSAEREGQANS